MKGLFTRHCIPCVLRTDNGRKFVISEFKRFVEERGIHLIASSRYHSRSNGKAKSVKIIESSFKKENDAWLGLSAYRATPLYGGPGPDEMLRARKLRTSLQLNSNRNDLRKGGTQERNRKEKDEGLLRTETSNRGDGTVTNWNWSPGERSQYGTVYSIWS